jgi:NitT/TauT family transport system ATP-binding protein
LEEGGREVTGYGIELSDVTKQFVKKSGEGVTALSGIDLAIEDGEFVSLVGASGCGKSTLLRMVDGLTRPSSGRITIGGHPVSGPGEDRAFVFQQDRLFPWKTVEDNVALGLQLGGTSRSASRERARELLSVVGLSRFAKSYPGELSGGMRQRANIARAYAVEPRILLMDEPYAALDGQTREIMQSWLLETWDATRRTVLFVTHQIDEAVYLSDRVVVMTARPGRVKDSIPIDLPRPRELAVKRTPEFAAYVDRIWQQIEEEVRQSMETEMKDGAA